MYALTFHNWFLKLRSEELTAIFRLFPFFASDSFYIITIASGYWLRRHSRIFLDLGFIVSSSTLLNCILKVIFSINRPLREHHLVQVYDTWGFPSGDVQVATAFWIIIYLHFHSKLLRIFSLILIINIAMSRIYLGVHSLWDVIGGFCVGILTAYFYVTPKIQSQFTKWLSGDLKTFWILLAGMVCLYGSVSFKTMSPMAFMAIGSLMGYGLALSRYNKFINEVVLQNSHFQLIDAVLIILSFLFLFALEKVWPKFSDLPTWLSYFLLSCKYSVIVLIVYGTLPKLQFEISSRIFRNNSKNI